MAKTVQRRRLLTMAVLLGVAFATLGYRLVDLQVFHHESLRKEAADKIQWTVLREPRRGEIRDRQGNLLAGSVFVKSVYANPMFLSNRVTEVSHALAPLLDMDEGILNEKLQLRTYINEKGETKYDSYVVVKRKVPLDAWDEIQKTMQRLFPSAKDAEFPPSERALHRALRNTAIFTDRYDDQMRVYPNKTLGSHVLGYVGFVDRQTIAGPVREMVGLDGIERIVNSALAGVSGWRVTEMVKNRELVTSREQDVEPHPGHIVILTIDAGLQHIVESELADAVQKFSPESASAIVVRPPTGEVLALANLPTFDPNHFGDAAPSALRNRAITDCYEPGSTFKIVAVSAALNEGLVGLETRFDCEGGRTFFAGKPLRDDHPSGILSVEEIVGKSSNIGTFKIACQVGAPRLYQYIRNYGFGTVSGIPLLGEENGIVHPPKEWSKLSISRVPIGQGIAVTPLQMVMAMCVIANGGRLMRPMLIDRVVDDSGHVVIQNRPQQVRQAISEATAKQMVTALKTVVSTNGTARKAMLDHYLVAGKTGTAQKPEHGGYLGKHVSSFVGFFPADHPELCITVVLDDPKPVYYASSTAAPIFRKIAERAAKYLAIKPDIAPGESLAVNGPNSSSAPSRDRP